MKPNTEKISYALGILSVLLGALVLFGWHQKIPSLIQVHSSFVPMQYNTALGFLFCGGALIVINFSSSFPCGVLGGTASAIGALTLIQYLFGLNFGLDEFFMKHYVLVKTSHPGRMAPNTALCFTITGISLAFYGFLNRSKKTILIMEILGAIVAALGLVSLVGYLSNVEAAFGWGKMTRMAVHTSIGFIILGAALVFFSKASIKAETKPRFPTFLTIGLVTTSLFLWNALEVEKTKNIKSLIFLESEKLNKGISNSINREKRAITRMAARWENGDYQTKGSWEADVLNYVKHSPSLLMIAWVSPDFMVDRVVPLEGNEVFRGLDLSTQKNQMQALSEARERRGFSSAESISPSQRRANFNLFAPLYSEEGVEGFTMSVYDGVKLINSVLPNQNTILVDAAISKKFTENLTAPSISLTSESEVHSVLEFEGLSLDLDIEFTEDLLGASILPEVVGISGLLLTFFCGTTMYFGQKSRLQAASLRKEIAERNKAEKQIRKLSQAVEQSPASVLITDTSGNIEYVNPSFTGLTGYAVDEVKGGNPRILKYTNTPPAVYKELWDTITAGKEWRGEIRNIKKSGEPYWALLTISPIKDENGVITHFSGTMEDITERKNWEKQLLESETRFRTLVDKAVDSIFLHDHEGQFIHVNSKACESLGYSRDELILSNVADIEQGIPIEELKNIWSTISKGRTVILEGTHKRKEGTLFPVEIHLGRIDFQESDYFIAIARDISERKRAEEAIKSAQQEVMASQKMASIGQLAAGVSHEVLNPLNILSVHLQMLTKMQMPNSKVGDHLDKMGNEVHRIEKIVRALLTFSRKSEAEPQFIDIERELNEICDLVTNEFQLENIHIKKNFSGDLEATSFDKDEWRQVFLNLINNARQAMPNGGTLTLATKNVETRNAHFVEVAVSDTGVGIDKEILEKIFDPFFTTKEEGKGTGLGLSVCHGIVEKNGGAIKVESEKGKQTKFVINLPAWHDNGA